MELKIKKIFRDKDNFSKVYNIGDVVDFEKNRAEYIISLGLAEKVEQPKQPETLEMQTEETTNKRSKRNKE
jgi:hypothetical protein